MGWIAQHVDVEEFGDVVVSREGIFLLERGLEKGI